MTETVLRHFDSIILSKWRQTLQNDFLVGEKYGGNSSYWNEGVVYIPSSDVGKAFSIKAYIF
jgi:hypothetical protein